MSKKVIVVFAVVVFVLTAVALYLEHNKPVYQLTLNDGDIYTLEAGKQPPMPVLLAERVAVPAEMSGDYSLSDGGPGIIWLNRQDVDKSRAVAYFAEPGARTFKNADRIDLEQGDFKKLSDYLATHSDGQTVLTVGR